MIDRTVFNALVDDDGSNGLGTILTKNVVKTAIMDPVDAAITADWIVPTFNAAAFFGTGALVWTVEAGDLASFAYRRQGNTMQVAFQLNTTSLSGTPNAQLNISNAMWGGAVAKRGASALMAYILNNGLTPLGSVQVVTGGTVLVIKKADSSTFAVGTNDSYFWGTLGPFEVNP